MSEEENKEETKKQTWLLQQIHKVFREIEGQARDHDFPEMELNKLIILLGECEQTSDESVQRLSQIRDHLHPKMTLRHFLNFMVPVERQLDRSLKDDDFIITHLDKNAEDFGNSKDIGTEKIEVLRRDLYFILDNMRSAFNVGSIFRLADGLGTKEILLCGYTATPDQDQIKKTSMQTHEYVKWSHWQKTEDAIKSLRSQGIYVIALETAHKAIPLHKSPIKGPTAFVVGNERFGLDREILNLVDEVRSIKMYGIKNSLNVANSLSIAAHEWSRQNEF